MVLLARVRCPLRVIPDAGARVTGCPLHLDEPTRQCRLGPAYPHTVVMSSASSKSALATACQLRWLSHYRLVALTSARNISYTRDTSLYHQVLNYDDVASLATNAPTTIVDFLGRESLIAKVHDAFGESLTQSVMFGATDWTDKPGGVQAPKVALRGPIPEVFFTSSHQGARLGEDPALSGAMQRDTRAFYPARANS